MPEYVVHCIFKLKENVFLAVLPKLAWACPEVFNVLYMTYGTGSYTRLRSIVFLYVLTQWLVTQNVT